MSRIELSPPVPIRPELDPGFLPAALWNRAYRERVAAAPDARPLRIALARPDGTCFVREERILPAGAAPELDLRFVERLVKGMLWDLGGSRLYLAGAPEIAAALARTYAAGGDRAFDDETIGRRIFGEPLRVRACAADELPPARAAAAPLGRHWQGCRIGFDLGGSDRKCAAVIDGEVVHSEEVPWDPYFQADPDYHLAGIQDSLARAAAHLPRVDAIGGSAAGVYVGNEVRVASLFRGVPPDRFESEVRRIFPRLRERWGGVPFEVVNDGEVTALAGSMSLGVNALLGVALGTSTAAGWCDEHGHIGAGLTELAFSPVDLRPDAPADEWSGDRGCGVQYLSQQAVARLAPAAGIELPAGLPPAERLVAVQERVARGDDAARSVFRTIGVYLGYAVAHWAETWPLRHLLLLGRVTSGEGGAILRDQAARVLAEVFPELAERVRLHLPDEKAKRHGQAVAAASLPASPPPE
ncbi:MAG: ROK family protein [Planctomycetota bacterium]|nr:MAG: ROK family protein [Planctomycetota bacterium]